MSPQTNQPERQEPSSPVTGEAQNLAAFTLERIAAAEVVDPFALEEARLRELLLDPDLSEEHRPALANATEELVKGAINAHKHAGISDERLLGIGDTTLEMVGQYRDKVHAAHAVQSARGLLGFESAMPAFAQLFARLGDRIPASPAEDAHRMTRFFQFASPGKQRVHNGFVNRYINELTHGETGEIQEMWSQPEFLSLMGERFANNFRKLKKPTTDWPESEKALLNKTFQAFGFNEEEKDDLLKAWAKRKSAGNRDRFGPLTRSFSVMSDLMTAGPDTVGDVYHTFGIRHFGRYQAADLLRQRSIFNGEIPKPEGPLALSVAAIADWNGSLSRLHERIGAAQPIYTEAGSLSELARALVRTKRQIGPIGSLIVCGHGNKDHVALGRDSSVTASDMLQSKALARIRKKGFFTPDADIIIMSCSTGKKGGIAQTVSKVSGIQVIASPRITSGRIEKLPEQRRHTVVFPDHERRFPFRRNRNVALSYRGGKAKTHQSVDLFD